MHDPLSTATSFPLRNTLTIALSVLLLLVLLAYITYQARFLILGPQITLTDTGQTPTTAQTVTLAGTAENITHMTLNGRPIFTDQTGAFTETLVLSPGYNLSTIVARDRYGRKQTVTQEYVQTTSKDTSATSTMTRSDQATATN